MILILCHAIIADVLIISVPEHYYTQNVEIILIICLNITVKPLTIHRLSISYASSKNLYL